MQQGCERGKGTRLFLWLSRFSHMKVARSGLMNGLKLKLMGGGEITRLWCS